MAAIFQDERRELTAVDYLPRYPPNPFQNLGNGSDDAMFGSISRIYLHKWVVRDSLSNLQTNPFDPLCGYIRS